MLKAGPKGAVAASMFSAVILRRARHDDSILETLLALDRTGKATRMALPVWQKVKSPSRKLLLALIGHVRTGNEYMGYHHRVIDTSLLVSSSRQWLNLKVGTLTLPPCA